MVESAMIPLSGTYFALRFANDAPGEAPMTAYVPHKAEDFWEFTTRLSQLIEENGPITSVKLEFSPYGHNEDGSVVEVPYPKIYPFRQHSNLSIVEKDGVVTATNGPSPSRTVWNG